MSDQRLQVVEEEARVAKERGETERVRVRTIPEHEFVVLRDEVLREHLEITRVPVEREVAEAPSARTDGNLTIIPVVEERLVIEKRLFVVEEVHVRRLADVEAVELPATVLRTRVEIEREDLTEAGPNERSGDQAGKP